MSRYKVLPSPSSSRSRPVLPPGHLLRPQRAAGTLVERLSLSLGTQLPVALSADDADSSFYLGVVDELGHRGRSVFFGVHPVERGPGRRAGRLASVGDRSDRRQLLLPCAGGAR